MSLQVFVSVEHYYERLLVHTFSTSPCVCAAPAFVRAHAPAYAASCATPATTPSITVTMDLSISTRLLLSYCYPWCKAEEGISSASIYFSQIGESSQTFHLNNLIVNYINSLMQWMAYCDYIW